jgi:hypothetical protein
MSTTLNYKFDLSTDLEDKSFALLRTNPRLSGNNKIVVTTGGEIYLETIDANTQLASSKYKKHRLSKDGDYSFDLASFYNDNATPYDLIYDVKREVPNDLTAFNDYEFQYEDTYRYGAGISYSKLYDETFKIFVPFWLEKKVPTKFVIYRLNGVTNDGDTTSTKVVNMLKNADIVKVFDMSKDSELGAYLRKHAENENFPNSAIVANFNKNENFLYRGIDLKNGGFVTKSEYIFDDIVGYDNAIINVNEYITDGLKRNAIISANLINLEFQFNDPSVDPYEINRYFGLFVDEIEEGRLNVKNLVHNNLTATQYENYYDLSAFSFIDSTNFALPRYEDFDDATLGYVTSKKGYHNIKNGNRWEVGKIPLGGLSGVTFADFDGFEKQDFTLRADEFKGSDFDRITFTIDGSSVPTNGDKLALTRLQKQIWKFNFTTLSATESVTITISDGITTDSFDFITGSSMAQTLINFESAWPKFSNIVNITGNTGLASTTNQLVISGLDVTTSLPITKYVKLNDGTYTPILTSVYGGVNTTITFVGTLDASYLTNVIAYDLSLFATNYDVVIEGDTLIANETLNTLIVNDISYSATISKMKIKAGADHVDLNNYIISADSSLAKGTTNGNYFSCLGSLEDVAYAIESCLKQFSNEFKVSRDKSIITVTSNISRFRYPNLALLNFSTNIMTLAVYDGYLDSSNYLNISIPGIEVYGLTGGHADGRAFLIHLDDWNSGKILVGDYIGLQSISEYALVLDIVRYNDIYAKVIVDCKKPLAIRKSANVYRKYYPTIGKFSAYSIKDFDFDFYSTTYSDLYELKLESYSNMEPTPTPTPSIINNNSFNSNFYNSLITPADFFAFLLPSLEAEDSSIVNTIDPLTEYDRLQENYNTTLFSKSRIVPYINKFSLKDAVNVRETPYSLNISEAFGKTNFAADIEVEGRLPQHMTHEWFYLDKFPIYSGSALAESVLNTVYPEEIFSYLNFDAQQVNQSLSLSDFNNVTTNVFDKFMVYDGYGYNVNNTNPSGLRYYDVHPTPKYSIFNDGSNQTFAKTNFRGLQFTIKERKESTTIIPTEFNISNKYNSYKFTTTLLSTISSSEEQNLFIKIIANERFKTVSLLLDLHLQETLMTYVNRRFLYELKGRYNNTTTGNPSDTVMSGYLDLLNLTGTGPSGTGPYMLNGVDTQFTTQITLNNEGVYEKIFVDLPAGSSTPNIYLSIKSVINDNTLILSEYPQEFNGTSYSNVDLSNLSFSEIINAGYIYLKGGSNAHNEILSKLSARYIHELLETNNTNDVEYITVKEDGTLAYNQFILNIDDGVDVYKPTILTVSENTKIPSSFRKSTSAIGYNLTNRSNPYITHLKRLNGSYNPTFTDVIDFYNPYNKYKVFLGKDISNINNHIAREMIFNQKLFREGITFMTNRRDYGVIKNLFYHKVNEINQSAITKLSPTTALKPVYPLINEVTIDKKDINVFTSNFENGYYTRSLANGGSELVYGTKSPVSKKSFMSSTAMQPQKNLYLTKFSTANVASLKDLNTIRDLGKSTTQTVIFETKDQIFVDFYNETVIVDELLEAGVLSTIKKYVSPSQSYGDLASIEDDARQYALKNLNPLYKIESLQLYVKQINSDVSNVASKNSPEEVIASDYTEDGNFTYQLHANKPFNLRLIYNKRVGYTYSILPIIKISI